MKANETIRKAARAAGIPLWKIADVLGVCEQTLIRWLRKPLDQKREKEIMDVISQMEQEAK